MPGPGIFAVFCTSNLSIEKVNDVLTKAASGASFAYDDGWYLWLATETLPEGDMYNNVTKPPIKSIPTTYVGQDYKALASTLKRIDGGENIEHEYFAVLDDRTETDGSVAVCYCDEDSGDVKVVRFLPKESTLTMRGLAIVCMTWDEMETARDGYVHDGKGDVLD